MSTFELSEYQKRILDFIKYENGNLLVDAKAGSGKTSTLVLIADEIIKQNKKCLFLAFNKSIVEELKTKIISDSCQIKTLHSLGLSFLRSFLYKKHGENYVIDIDQHDEQIKQEVEKLFEVYCRQDFNIANAEMGSDDRDDLYYNLLREVASMVNYSRLYNCNYHEPEQLYDLAPKLCWYLKDYEDYGMKRFPEIVEKVIDGIKESFENPVKDEADIPHYRVTYTDMIYFPCLYKMRPPFSLRTFLDYVLVDECIQGDMYVTTEKGKKKIKTLFDMYKYNRLNGLKVKTFNEKTKEFEYKEIVNVKKKDPKLVYELETYGLNKIRVTDNHPILTQNGWKQLKDLKCNEDAIFLDNVTNQKCKLIPNEDQLQVIYGTALGDGNLKKISKENYSYRLRICHSEKQYNYFKFKKDLLHCNYEYTTEGGYEAHSIIYNTTSSNFLLFGIKDKIDMINKLDERGLAILFMDDGSVCQKNPYSTIHISCNSFNNEETKALISKFREFGIEVENKPHVNMQNKSYNEIKMDSENGHKFLHLIAPYMNEDCFYKNPEAIGDYKWNNKFMNYGGNVVKSITSLKEEVVYDMEVKDNHNFLISVSSVNPKGSSVIVHNCQDLSVLQQMFVKLFVGYNTRMIAVGDEKQCQPEGTKVLMKDKTEKNIEDIKPGDKVIGYIHTSQETYFTDNEDIEVEDIQQLKAQKLYKITLENGLTSSYTYNHKCYVKIKDNFNEGYLVYLMRNSEGYYRVGKTKMYSKGCKMFGLRGRLRQENCQDAWIIKYCSTEQDAWILEQKISLKYGIPQLIFHKVVKNQRCDYEQVKDIHNFIGREEIETRAIKLLEDYDRSIEYPFLSLYDGRHIAHTHSFITQACNIIPELMDCIIYDENNKTIKSRSYNKSHQYLLKKVRATYIKIKSLEILKGNFNVYGLKVKRTENYVADGILTHNCIYAFAGADTKSIKNLKKNFDLTELPLNTCYRCPKNVIKLAQDIVPSIDWNHKREDDGIVEFIDDSNLKDKLQPGDVILARRNNDLVRLYKKLVLDEKISIKFKNQEMVTTIINEIKKVIKEYIKRYNAYANVEKELYRLCDEKGINWRKDDKHLSKTDKSFMQSKYKELVRQNKQTSKQICKSNYNIDYLKTCMDEYKEKGEYAFTYDGQKDNICVEYFDVIESLLEQYKQNESGILVNDFIVYTESFLKGNIYKEVPILSSIHMMKGGEADNVFIIDYPRFPYIYSNQTEDAQQQEKNLQYVALTRPKKNLYLCRISRCRNRETEEDIDRLNTKCEFDVRAALKRGEC